MYDEKMSAFFLGVAFWFVTRMIPSILCFLPDMGKKQKL